MIDALRPRLLPTARFRLRSDGTAGVWDPQRGVSLEVASDEAQLLDTLDGRRSLSEIAEDYSRQHGFVPFTALRDLLHSLARVGLLANPPAELEQAGLRERRSRLERLADEEIVGVKLPAGRLVAPVGALVFIIAGVLGFTRPEQEISALDVVFFYVGTALALSARSWFKSAAAALFGQVPERLELSNTLLVLHVEPDANGVDLLDRWPRVIAHAAGILGCLTIVGATWWEPGMCFGAVAALLGDLCPFEPTGAGKLMGALAGKVDLRDHARAYLSKRLLKRAVSGHVFDGEISLVFTLVLSLGWFALLIQVLFKPGLIGALSLLAVAVDTDVTSDAERWLAYFGAGALALLMPVSLLGLVYALFKAATSLRPARESHAGQSTGGAIGQADLAHIPLFAHLGPNALAALAKAVKEVRYPAGARIVTQGESGDRFFAIRSGEVSVERELESGLTRDVAHLGPGDCFGETALLERVPRTANVRALRDTVVATLSGDDFQKVCASLPGVDVTSLLRAAATLHRSRFFAKLPPERLSALALKLQVETVPAGETVVKAGDPGDRFYLIGSGALEVVDTHGNKVHDLKPGDHFGEIALLRDVPRTATVRATEESLLLALPKENFIRAMAADLTLSARIEELAAERTEELR